MELAILGFGLAYVPFDNIIITLKFLLPERREYSFFLEYYACKLIWYLGFCLLVTGLCSHILHDDILVNDRPLLFGHCTALVPRDYNGAKKFLLSSDIVAVITQCITCVCGDVGVNTALPVT